MVAFINIYSRLKEAKESPNYTTKSFIIHPRKLMLKATQNCINRLDKELFKKNKLVLDQTSAKVSGSLTVKSC